MKLYKVTVSRNVIGWTAIWIKAESRREAICIAINSAEQMKLTSEINEIRVEMLVDVNKIIEQL